MKIQQYLPSQTFRKRTIAIIIIVAIIIFLPKIWNFLSSKFKSNKITNEQAEIIAGTDTDGDGIYDWQEKLWGTDPNKTETFGIPDAKYIKNKQAELDTTDADSDNKTDILSKQLFATVNAIKANNTLNPEESYKEIADSVAQFVTDNPNTDATNITSKDIQIVPVNTETKKTYAKSISSLNTFFGKNTYIGTETKILYYALVNEDPTHLEDMDPIISDYENLAKKLTNIKVPQTYAADHIQLINTIYLISASLKETKSLFSDSVVGIRGLVEYNKASTELDTIIDRLQQYASN
ncbi:MAG: thrombospondin type 3 repeat-containing protein [Minisyncoccia bacterium]